MDKIEELICEFNAERDWRVKKIEIYKSIPHRYVNKLFINIKNSYLEMCIPMIYAHWEGFVVYMIKRICKFINDEKITYNNINDRIAIFSFEPQMKYISGNASLDKRIKFFYKYREIYSKPVYINYTECVSAKSNLNFRQLELMLDNLCIKVPNEIKCKKSIIEKLVTYRNKIAHGENSVVVNENDVRELAFGIILFIDILIVTVKEYIVKKEFLKEAHP